MAYATLTDLTDRYTGATTGAEVLLDDASFWLKVWVPGLDDAIPDNEDVTTAAMLLVVAMVKRALTAPAADLPYESAVAGPFTVRYRNPDGNLFLYARELEAITSLLRSSQAEAVSMRSTGL